jgi:hypothetical protein
MPKYDTNPSVMSGELGIIKSPTTNVALAQPAQPAQPSSASSDPFMDFLRGRTPAAAEPTVPATGAATVGGGCVKVSTRQVFQYALKGYKPRKNSAGELFMCPPGVELPADPVDPGTEETTTPGTGLGEFSWPQELKDLYNLLISRGSEFLGSPGYSDQALSYAFGNDFEKIRQQEAAAREQMQALQSSQGLLGTGAAAQQMSDLAWGNEGDISTLMRDIFLQNEAQKRADVTQGQGIFGTGVDFAALLEQLNAARRGEGTAALSQLLQLLQILKGS